MNDDVAVPTARHLLPLLPIVLVVAWVVRSFEVDPWVSTRTAVGIAVAAAGLVGLPTAHWALSSGRYGAGWLIPLGAMVGLMPQFLILCPAILRLLVRLGVEQTLDVLEDGAPFPAMGVMAWPTFARAQLSAAGIGAWSGLVYWLYLSRIARYPHASPLQGSDLKRRA